MSVQTFQLDPSLAGLSPAVLKKRYDQLTPEERRQLGFTRLATDQEAASAQQSPQGAPANFGGPVLPNPNRIKVSDDTDSGVEPTRLPNGVNFQHGNFSGAMPSDMSNPPRAALAGQTVGVKSSGLTPDQFMAQQGGALTPDQFMAQQSGSTAKAEPSLGHVLTRPTEESDKDYLSLHGPAGVAAATIHGLNDVGRGFQGALKGTWDTLTAPPQDDTEKAVGELSPAALPLFRTLRSLGHTAADATQIAGAIHDINASRDPLRHYAQAAQDTFAQGAGQALTALAGEGAAKTAPAVADTLASPTKMTAPLRAVAPAVNAALKRVPGAVGTAAGYAAGRATGLPEAGVLGGGLGYALTKDIPMPRIPENIGLPSRVEGGPATLPPEAADVTPPASDVLQAKQNAGEQQLHALSGDSALRQILTGQDNANLLKIAKSRGINVAQESQLKPGVADNRLINKIIDDHSPEELDNISAQYEENTRMGKHQFGDVGPEAWKTMSLQQYFPDVKIPAATLRRTQNAIANTSAALPQGIVMDPTTGRPQFSYDVAAKPRATPAAAAAATPAAGEDLTAIRQKSLNQARQRAGVPPEPVTTNASGESAASQEAINRVASEKTLGMRRYRIDTRSGNEIPLIGVDAVDAQPGPYDVIVERGPKGEMVLDTGSRARPYRSKATTP